jgi:hypothetical protein
MGLFSVIFYISCEQPRAGLDQLFPGAGFEKGWSWHGKPKIYSPQNLYEYIDGEAELYLSYDFKELATLIYFWGSSEDTFFTVDVYDMGTPLNAFGLYSSYRYPGYQYEKIGTESFVSDFGLKFFQGRFVVEIKSSDESEKCGKAVRVVAGLVADRIIDPVGFPDLIRLLPETDQIPQTLRYYAKEMLNQSFLPQGLEAKYRLGDEEATGFTILFENNQSAEEGLEKLKSFYEESGGQFTESNLPKGIAFSVKTPYHGYTLLAINGKVLNGIQDLSNPEKGFTFLLHMSKIAFSYSSQK